MRLKSALRRGVAAAVIAGIGVSSGIPAYAARWDIANGDITVKAGDAEGKNKVSQGETIDKDDTNTVITGESDKNTVTIDTSEGNVDVTFDDLKIDVSGKKEGDGSGKTEVYIRVIRAALEAGRGAIVSASRSVIGAWQKTGSDGRDWAQCAQDAACKMRDDLAKYVTVI